MTSAGHLVASLALSRSSTSSSIISTNASLSSSPSTPLGLGFGPEWQAELDEGEKIWRDRYSFFLDRGLQLRPRYRPGWNPSWIGTSKDPTYCEDAIVQIIPMVLDAKRLKDGQLVCLKLIQKQTKEVDIARALSSIHHPSNHCVRILDSFQDPILPHVNYLVMPILRPFNDPEFWAVGEVVDFVSQILEGLDFLHSQLVSHGDLTGPNIMMDARYLYPNGWHFVADQYSPDGINLLTPLARIDYPVRYFIVDYDCSKQYAPDEPHQTIDDGGSDSDPPELAKPLPYDPFKLDVFTLGNVLKKHFWQTYLGLDFLLPLIEYMMIPEYQQRPSSSMVLQKWNTMMRGLDVVMARWRLRKPDESVRDRVVLDTVAAARQGIHSLKYLFHDKPRTWSNP